MKRLQYQYLHFTRKEKNGIVVVLAVAVLIIFMPRMYAYIFESQIPVTNPYQKQTAALKLLQKDSSFYADQSSYKRSDRAGYTNYRDASPKGELFYFDPNTLTVSGWQKLGVKEKTAIGIQHYIEKGGRFKQPDDLKKIWGLRPEMTERLLPYVRITASEQKANFNSSYPQYEKKVYEKKSVMPVDINSGDTSAYIKLPGIGSKLAARIVTFRDKLGGFYAINQVAETFGLSDSTFQKIKPYLQFSGTGIKKINLNTITNDELKIHPYIRWQLANVIIQYRKQHGNFKSVNDLKKIMIITDEIYAKISPYLSVE